MDINKYTRKQVILVAISTLIVVLGLFSAIPSKKELIMTPSTHQQIDFLTVKQPNLKSNIKIEFALQDKECDYVEICIIVPKNKKALLPPNSIDFFIDDIHLDKFSFINHSAFWNDYIIFLIEDVSDWEEIIIEHDGERAFIYKTEDFSP